jgi:hypothetical protein
LEWFGHVVRIDGERTVKMLLEGKPGGGGGGERERERERDLKCCNAKEEGINCVFKQERDPHVYM